ncbi:uncharacterized protein LOC144146685 [Haemaphysalis longicornis]
MQSQLTRNSRQRNSLSTTTKDISSFLDLAPSLNRARWEGVLLDYFNTSFGDLDDRVFIQDSRRFSAFFSLHRHFGEAKTLDFFGFLCVQALLPFTNRKLIESFHGDRSNVAAEWQRVYCLSTAYLAFKEAINSLLWNRSTQFKIQGLAHTVNAVFRDTLADNATLLHTESFIPHEVSIEPVFRAIAESGPSNVANSYRSYPDMTNDPLSNKIAVSSLLGSRAKTVTRPKWTTRRARDFVTHEKETAASYENFELSPQHHYFPWFESDVHLAVLYAGLGARLAASMFVALMNFQDDAEAVYAKNDRCLQPGGERVQPPDLNLQAAVVSLKIAWNAYAEVSTFVKVKDLLTLKRDAVFFAFNCWLACGRPNGESLCNVPLQQSAQFALVFNCSSTSTMNSTEKCNLFV